VEWRELTKVLAAALYFKQCTRAHSAEMDAADPWAALADFAVQREPTVVVGSGRRRFRGGCNKFPGALPNLANRRRQIRGEPTPTEENSVSDPGLKGNRSALTDTDTDTHATRSTIMRVDTRIKFVGGVTIKTVGTSYFF
jgi:hypothetical protein